MTQLDDDSGFGIYGNRSFLNAAGVDYQGTRHRLDRR